MRKFKLILDLGLVASLVAAFALIAGMPKKGHAEPIKISWPTTLSGAYGELGLSVLAAACQAVAEWNEKGGCLGRPVELLVQDDKGSPEVAVRIARDLVHKEKVEVLGGTIASSVGMAMSTFAKENKIVFACGPGATRPLTDKEWNRYTFRITANTVMRARGLSAGVAKIRKYKKLASINPDYTWGRTMCNDFIRFYREFVPDVEILKQFWPPTGETDYTPYITALMTSGAEAVQSALVAGDLVTFVSQAKARAFFNKVAYINDNSGSVLGTSPFGDKYPEGCIGAAFYVPYWECPENKAFLNKYHEYNSDSSNKWRSPTRIPGFHYVEGYDTINFILSSIAKAGTTNAEAVIKAAENLTFDTPIGPVTMRAFDHQLARPMFVGKTKVVPDYPIVPMVDGLVM